VDKLIIDSDTIFLKTNIGKIPLIIIVCSATPLLFLSRSVAAPQFGVYQ